MTRARAILAVVSAAAAIVTGFSGAATAQGPAAARLPHAQLVDVSCSSVTFCVAVGSYYRDNGPTRALAEFWNGRHWHAETPPRPKGIQAGFTAVQCRSRTFCMAVGPGFSDIWNGRHWHPARIPVIKPIQRLEDVSCTAHRRCIAVGFRSHKRTGNDALAESWNGRTWTQLPVQLPHSNASSLASVSCTSFTRCVAVGVWTQSSVGRRPLGEVWNGKRWAKTPLPNPDHTNPDLGEAVSALSAVSCTAVRHCVAFGYVGDVDVSRTLAERWTGTRWQRIATAHLPGNDSFFSGGTCISATRCRAVGGRPSAADGGHDTLAEAWRQGTWTVQPAESTGAENDILVSISCARATDCIAVGASRSGSSTGPSATLAEHWNGSAWQLTSTS